VLAHQLLLLLLAHVLMVRLEIVRLLLKPLILHS